MKHFKHSEFDSPDAPGSGAKMQNRFLEKLDLARDIAGILFIITSGYRTEEHNKLVGGVNSSSHTKGLAADISCRDSVSRFIIVNALFKAGFTRIGIADNFIHVDCDETKTQEVIWTY